MAPFLPIFKPKIATVTGTRPKPSTTSASTTSSVAKNLISAADKISSVCKAKASDPKLKTLLGRVTPFAEEPGKFLADENARYRTSLVDFVRTYPELMRGIDPAKVSLDGEWFAHIRDYYFKVYDDWAEKDNAKAMKMILREQWTNPGGTLDGMVYADAGSCNAFARK